MPDRSRRRWTPATAVACLIPLLLVACSTTTPSPVVLPATPASFAHAQASASASASTSPSASGIQTVLDALADPALPGLLKAVEQSAPTLVQALARITQARARLGTAQAGSQPQASAFAQGTRSNNSASTGGGTSAGGNPGATTGNTPAYDLATAGLSLSWEIDLFGRLAAGRSAAQARLDAADADAQMTRLALRSQVADTLVVYRACMLAASSQRDSLAASLVTLHLTEVRQGAGLAPMIDVSRAQTSTGEVRTSLVATEGQCEQALQSLAYLSDQSVGTLRAQLQVSANAPASQLLELPALHPAQPASVIARHPQVLRAQRNADAAWQDLGALRASRYPSLNLAATLATTLIQLGPFQQSFNSWSFGPSLSVALFDGGRIRASIEEGQGRYEESVAVLAGAVRDTVRDVELALIQGQTAEAAAAQASATLQASRQLYNASEAAQRAGRLSLFELESARLSLLGAQTNLINAHRDQARAWVALQKAAGVP